MEQPGQNRKHRPGPVHQVLGLKAMNVRQRQPVFSRIEQIAERAFQRIGLKGCFNRIGLQQHDKAGQGAFRDRRTCQTGQG